jgi:hypothetical protein
MSYLDSKPKPYLHFDHANGTVKWDVSYRARQQIRRDLETLDRVQSMKEMFFTDVTEVVQRMLKFNPLAGR